MGSHGTRKHSLRQLVNLIPVLFRYFILQNDQWGQQGYITLVGSQTVNNTCGQHPLGNRMMSFVTKVCLTNAFAVSQEFPTRPSTRLRKPV